MSQLNRVWNLRSKVLLLLAGLLLATSVQAGPLNISAASWDARRTADALYVKGTGEDYALVVLSDADSGEPVAQVTADRRGRWQYQARNPSSIPCRIRGVSKGVTVDRNVSNASAFPGGCGTAPVNTPPTVTISSPANGASFDQGATVNFSGTASDAEDGSLTSTIAWTLDGSTSVGSGASGSFSTAALSAGSHTLAARVTDSKGAPGNASINITVVVNQPPTVTISSPANGASFDQGATVNFSGTASDAEDGSLTGTIAWTLDGRPAWVTGASGSFSTAALSAGSHTLAARVTDSKGAPGTASISITVAVANQPPTVTITSPTNGASFTQGSSVSFSGTASDAEDGNLNGSLTWTSSRDGTIGSGRRLQHFEPHRRHAHDHRPRDRQRRRHRLRHPEHRHTVFRGWRPGWSAQERIQHHDELRTGHALHRVRILLLLRAAAV